jgi:hypothetical protein
MLALERTKMINTTDRPTIVCLCGSTRFLDAFHEANLRETLAGKIVLSIGCDFKSDKDLLLAGELMPEDKERLDELHMRKIELADEVLFLNVGGYMGQSTLREHFYAAHIGKTIRYLERPSHPNEYYVKASDVGVEWLREWRNQGRLPNEMHLINRRAWFRED